MNGIQEVGGSIPLGSTTGAPPPPDIAIYIKDLEGGGIQRQRLNLARALDRRGHAVELVVGQAQGSLCDQVPEGVTLHPLNAVSRLEARWAALEASLEVWPVTVPAFVFARKPARAFEYLPAMTHYLRTRPPRALLCGSPNQNIMVALARRAAGARCVMVLSEHNDLSSGHRLDEGRRGRLVRRMSKRLYRDARALVAVSEGVAEDMVRRLDVAADTIHIIHQPAVADDVDERGRLALDHPWFEEGDVPVVLSAGRFTDRKDFATLIRAFARVREKHPSRLVILGNAVNPEEDGARRESYRDLARSLGSADALDLPGYDPNPYRYMARAGVFVLSSRHEGMPNVLAEAMAVGCPVVSTDCPSGPREILAEGRFGRLVPVGDDVAMAEAMIATLESPPDTAALKARARILSADRSAARYEALLLKGG